MLSFSLSFLNHKSLNPKPESWAKAGKDALPTFLTIFGIVRDQYFYLGESIVSAIPEAETELGAQGIGSLQST